MEVTIQRTSTRYEEKIEKPCEGAYLKKFIRIDEHRVDDPCKIYPYTKDIVDEWYGVGINHRVENGHIKRDIESESWFVEIPDIYQFSQKYGSVIVGPSRFNHEIMEVEIYDDYQ